MKANELRLGNWINLYRDFYSQVTGITNTGKVWCVNKPTDEGCAWVIDTIKPIPLTEEWLVKFGFKRFVTADLHPTYVLNKIQVNDGVVYVSELGFFNHIKHVHQLQNLYFALVGEELTIK